MKATIPQSDAPVRYAHYLDGKLRERAIIVHVAGAGGTGSQVLTNLARLDIALRGLGHPGLNVTVFDPDKVSPANIGRQLFSPADVGCPKAFVLAQRLNTFFGLRWRAFCDPYTGEQAQSCDVLITCVDTARARREIAKNVVNGAPSHFYPYWLDLGNTRRGGQAYLTKGGRQDHILPVGTMTAQEFLSGERPLFNHVPLPGLWEVPGLSDVFDESVPEDNTPSCSLAEALRGQDLFINQAVALAGCSLLWQLLTDGRITRYGVYVNLEDGETRSVPVPALGAPKRTTRARCKAGTNG
jgi:PRTRC genetic system ThiF family protein